MLVYKMLNIHLQEFTKGRKEMRRKEREVKMYNQIKLMEKKLELEHQNEFEREKNEILLIKQ